MKHTLQEIAGALEVRLLGDGSTRVSGVASLASAAAGDLVFVEDEKYLTRAMQSGAGAVIAGEFATGASGKPFLVGLDTNGVLWRPAALLERGRRGGGETGVHASAMVQ